MEEHIEYCIYNNKGCKYTKQLQNTISKLEKDIEELKAELSTQSAINIHKNVRS